MAKWLLVLNKAVKNNNVLVDSFGIITFVLTVFLVPVGITLFNVCLWSRCFGNGYDQTHFMVIVRNVCVLRISRRHVNLSQFSHKTTLSYHLHQ